jgi:hypothetical protein
MIPQPYYQGQGPAFNRIVRRQLTDAERQLGAGYYKKLQQGLRGIAVFSIVLYVVNAYMLPVFSDLITYDTLSMVLTIFMIVIGCLLSACRSDHLDSQKISNHECRDRGRSLLPLTGAKGCRKSQLGPSVQYL